MKGHLIYSAARGREDTIASTFAARSLLLAFYDSCLVCFVTPHKKIRVDFLALFSESRF